MSTGDLTGAVLDERYKVLEVLAEGAMGVVYRAERLKLGKIVAIKVLHDELPNELSSRKRFEIEATAMAKLEHPNCAAVLDVGTHEGRPYVVMDFITGADLKSLVDQGPVPIARAIDIVRQVLSGVAHAHELGIIHRDIKPANIILSQKAGLGDHVKILDFGLARLQAEQTSKLTTGIVVGTPAYMAPEQIRGTGIDTRADLYACGVLLFELLTSHKPFHSEKDDPIEVVQMHLAKTPPRLEHKLVGVEFGELEDIVAKALAKPADARYQTAGEFAAALEGALRAHTARTSVAHAPTDPAGSTITDSQAQQISDSMMIPSGGTRLGLVAVSATPAVGAPVVTLPPSADTYVPPSTGTPAAGISTVAPPAAQPAALSSASALVSPLPPPTVEPDPMTHVPAIHARTRPPEKPLIPGVPLTNKQLKLGGGVLGGILLIGLVAKCASGGDAPKPPPSPIVERGSGSSEIDMHGAPADGADRILARADELIGNGDQAAALTLLDKSASAFPDNSAIPYRAGKLYFAKLWWTDGLRHFRNAVRIDPTYKSDPELIKIVLKGFITTPDYNRELADFLHDDLAPMSQQYLEETARDHPTKSIRARAKRELERYQ